MCASTTSKVHSSATERFRSIHKCLCPTFDTKYDLRFICHFETLQDLLLILCSLRRNIRDVTAKQIDGAVRIFDPLHDEKYIPHKHLSTFVQGLVPTFTKPTSKNVFFRERKAISSWNQ